MAVAEVASAHYRLQQTRARTASRTALQAWRRVELSDLSGSWAAGPSYAVLRAVVAGQIIGVQQAQEYVDLALREQGFDPDPVGQPNAAALAGVASDGRPLDTLLDEPVHVTKEFIGAGAPLSSAMAAGQTSLLRIVATQVQDAARVAAGVALTADRNATGWVRMLRPPSCGRCAVLAGKFFKWNTGFQRHPFCDCQHIPSREDVAGDLTTDPRAYFDSLSEQDQARYFTDAGAEAIRAGADVGQVVNARRGMSTASVYGRQSLVTSEGTTTRGLAGQRLGARQSGAKRGGARYRSARTPRLMPEAILEVAEDRDDAIRLLERFGYIV